MSSKMSRAPSEPEILDSGTDDGDCEICGGGVELLFSADFASEHPAILNSTKEVINNIAAFLYILNPPKV